MYLNLYMISRWLKGITDRQLSSNPMVADLTGVSPCYPGIILRSGIIYVGSASDFAEVPTVQQRLALVVTGQLPEQWMSQKTHDILICNEHLSVPYLIDQIQQIIQLYTRWEQSLLAALISHQPLAKLCELSLTIFENPILVHGVNFELLALAENDQYRYSFDYREAGTDFVRQDMIDMLLTDVRFTETFSQKTPQLYYDRWQMYDLYLNIFMNDTYTARIVIDAVCSTLSECDYVPIILLGQYIQRHLEMYSPSMHNFLNAFKQQLLRYILNPSESDSAIFRFTLNRINWDQHSHYACAYILPDTYASASKSINYQSELMEKTFQNCITISADTFIIAIFNHKAQHTVTEEFNQNLAVFIRDHLMRAGISTSFSDFMDIPAFFHQAKAALEYGEKSDRTTWIHAFADLQLDYILHNGLYTLPPKALIPAGLLSLIAYDQTHHANLYDTFRIYLQENCNIQKTIEKLFIHRSTFSYRLSRIYSFIPESMLDAPDKRLYFLNIFHLINLKSSGLPQKAPFPDIESTV